MDAAVLDQLLQRQSGDLPADGVKAGDGDGLGGVVDDQIDAGNRLQGPDVPALAADDAALHLVIGQGHHGNGGLRRVIGSAALNGDGNDLPGLFQCYKGCLLQRWDWGGQHDKFALVRG